MDDLTAGLLAPEPQNQPDWPLGKPGQLSHHVRMLGRAGDTSLATLVPSIQSSRVELVAPVNRRTSVIKWGS